MGPAALRLLKAPDQGINEALVQRNMAKAVSTGLMASWEVSAHSEGETVMVPDASKSAATSDPAKTQESRRFGEARSGNLC